MKVKLLKEGYFNPIKGERKDRGSAEEIVSKIANENLMLPAKNWLEHALNTKEIVFKRSECLGDYDVYFSLPRDNSQKDETLCILPEFFSEWCLALDPVPDKIKFTTWKCSNEHVKVTNIDYNNKQIYLDIEIEFPDELIYWDFAPGVSPWLPIIYIDEFIETKNTIVVDYSTCFNSLIHKHLPAVKNTGSKYNQQKNVATFLSECTYHVSPKLRLKGDMICLISFYSCKTTFYHSSNGTLFYNDKGNKNTYNLIDMEYYWLKEKKRNTKIRENDWRYFLNVNEHHYSKSSSIYNGINGFDDLAKSIKNYFDVWGITLTDDSEGHMYISTGYLEKNYLII